MSVSDLPQKEANVLKGHKGAVLRRDSTATETIVSAATKTVPYDYGILTVESTSRLTNPMAVKFATSTSPHRQVFYWDVSTGRVIRKFRGHDSEVNAVKFNEYSSVVVSAGYDQSLRAWDCRSHSNEPIQVIDTFSDSVMSVCLTKSEIIAGSVDGTVRTFDMRIGRSSGELLQEYKGHTCKSYKLDCCLTNTDAHVTGGSEDGFIYFWDLVDASVVSSFRAHSSVVTSVSYHPKDSCMVTASVDGTIRVWKT
uniref:Uncharacterized protein n=1 Tax=Fagus sylvatica TaxID=28930 RepID=A0A2N9GWF1_FAGSY